jgi:putative transposase
MKRHQFSDQQILEILEKHEEGVKMAELCKAHGVSPATVYRWKSRFGGLSMSEAQRLRQMEDENQRLKQLVADLSLDREALRAEVRRRGSLSAK